MHWRLKTIKPDYNLNEFVPLQKWAENNFYTRHAIYRWIQRGSVRAFKHSKRWFIHEKDAKNYKNYLQQVKK